MILQRIAESSVGDHGGYSTGLRQKLLAILERGNETSRTVTCKKHLEKLGKYDNFNSKFLSKTSLSFDVMQRRMVIS